MAGTGQETSRHRYVALTPHKISLLCLTHILVSPATTSRDVQKILLSTSSVLKSQLTLFLIKQLKRTSTNDSIVDDITSASSSSPVEMSFHQLMKHLQGFGNDNSNNNNIIAQALRLQLEALVQTPDSVFEFLQDLPCLFEAPENTQPPLVRYRYILMILFYFCLC